jgi:diacylglycerol kinase (ATP)
MLSPSYTACMRRASIIWNPTARNSPSRARLDAAASAWNARGWDIGVVESHAPGHSTELARDAVAAGSNVVFACGGDGTVNEVVNGLAGTEALLGVLRAGTGNVFGKEVRVPRRLESALDVLEGGRAYTFDLGFAEGERVVRPNSDGRRYFLLMCGIGFDGAVVHRVPRVPKRLLGTTSYVLWGAAEAVKFKRRLVQVSVDGRAMEHDLYWMLLGNTRSYGGVADVAMHAVADDGLLEVYMFSGGGIPWIFRMGARIAFGRHHGSPDVAYCRAQSLSLDSPGLDVQADGEYFGPSPMRFGVARRALRVLLTPGAPERILTADP